MTLRIPAHLAEMAESDGRGAWLATLPAAAANAQERWSLALGEPFEPGGTTAWVAPARTDAGHAVVLKLAWRHPEAEHEADALRMWDGAGSVRLLASADLGDTIALLLERCLPGTSLVDRPQSQQHAIVAGLLRRLWVTPPRGHPFRSLQVMCDAWADEFEEECTAAPVDLDPGLAREGIALLRSLPATAAQEVLLCTDLHAGNVLAAEREPWLVIDPKPYVGDPTYDPLQHLLNCDDLLHADPHGLAGRMAALLDLDRERLLLWLFARCVQESPHWPALARVARRVAPG